MFKLDCSQTHITFSCDYDLSPISRGCHFMGIVKTAYIGRIHTETIIRVRQIIRFDFKMKGSSFWIDNPPDFTHLFFRQF